MFQHISQDRLLELSDEITQLPVAYDATTRSLFFGGVDPRYVGLLPVGLAPAVQLGSDLNHLNRLERLADGSVPFLTWLRNLAAVTSAMAATEKVQSALDDIARNTSGAPRFKVADLPERKEKIVHQNDLLPHGYIQGALTASRSVAKLQVPRFEAGVQVRNPDPVQYLGTGWLVTGSLLLTNHHVINARNEGEPEAPVADFKLQAGSTTVIFDFDDDALKGRVMPVRRLETADATLDFALLRLDPTGIPPLKIAPRPVRKPAEGSLALNVIQHPAGLSKKFGIRNNLLSGATDRDVRYFTDTMGGSSGSPVLDDHWKVVALHRGATYAQGVSFQGRDTAWVNLGTAIHAILDELRAKCPEVADEIKREE